MDEQSLLSDNHVYNTSSNSALVLYEYSTDTCCLLTTGLYDLGGHTPYEIVMQHTPDISEYVIFKWYQWAYYWDELEKEQE